MPNHSVAQSFTTAGEHSTLVTILRLSTAFGTSEIYITCLPDAWIGINIQHRRRRILLLVMLNSLTVLSVFASGEFSGASGCLCTYGNPCWPDAAIFSQLESQVSQPLIYPIPTASACYPASNPSGNCSEVIQNWTDGNWRSSIPGSMDAPNFESFVFKNGTISACYLNTSLGVPCEQGSVPVIGVDARTPADIQAAVNFAIQYNLKLVVKNTGLVKVSSSPNHRDLDGGSRHDFLGRSAARGAFIVWTHNMKNITYDATFAPQGAPSNETYEGSAFSCHHCAPMVTQLAIFTAVVTLGAGVQWYEAYYAVNQYGRMMVGGITPGGSIGAAGGWLQGGGHSVLSPTYGLGMVISTVLLPCLSGYCDPGVDNAIEITVVTPTGEYLTVNDYQYSDLFWALRGGGGGTYGVVTSVTYRTYESLPVASYFFQANVTNTTIVNGLATRMLQLQANLTDDGWGGFGYLSNISMSFVAIAPNMSTEAANASIQPWTEYVQSQDISSVAEILPIPSWYEWYSGLFNTSGGNGLNLMITTRLLSRNTTANKFKEIAELLIDCGGQFM